MTTWLLSICVPRTGRFPSALNTWSKVWPRILIWAYLIWNFAPISGQKISILDPLYIEFFGPSWSELSPYGLIAGGGRLGLGQIFCHGQKRDNLSRASQHARGATKMNWSHRNGHKTKWQMSINVINKITQSTVAVDPFFNSPIATSIQPLLLGVWQESVLGPLLYILSTVELSLVIGWHGSQLQQHANNSQLHILVSDAVSLLASVIRYIYVAGF